MTINMTNITNANTTFQILEAVNEASGNLFANMLLVFVFLILFIALKLRNYDTSVVFTVACFVTSIISIAFVFTGLAAIEFVTIPIVATFVGIFAMYVSRNR